MSRAVRVCMSMDNVSVVLKMGVWTIILLQKARGSEKQ